MFFCTRIFSLFGEAAIASRRRPKRECGTSIEHPAAHPYARGCNGSSQQPGGDTITDLGVGSTGRGHSELLSRPVCAATPPIHMTDRPRRCPAHGALAADGGATHTRTLHPLGKPCRTVGRCRSCRCCQCCRVLSSAVECCRTVELSSCRSVDLPMTAMTTHGIGHTWSQLSCCRSAVDLLSLAVVAVVAVDCRCCRCCHSDVVMLSWFAVDMSSRGSSDRRPARGRMPPLAHRPFSDRNTSADLVGSWCVAWRAR
jgi:hypothetical protein